MSKINVRSPYFIITEATGLDFAELNLYIYTGSRPSQPTYQFIVEAQDSNQTGGRSSVFEISEIVRDYISNSFDGEYSSQNVNVDYTIQQTYLSGSSGSVSGFTELIAFDGYGYFEDGVNPQNDSVILQSNKKIYTNDFANINIPIHVKTDTTVTYSKDGEPVFTKTLLSSTNSSQQIQYVSNSSLDADVFYNRVIDDGGTIEAFSCVQTIANGVYAEYDADKIYIDNGEVVEVINVEEIEECKYSPYKITFVNKFGALQDLWFFKKSSLSMKTKNESYKANISNLGSYSINDRQNIIFKKTGKESLVLNTGFYPEEYNEIFRQLSLSEEVWINYEEKTLAVNITSSSLNYKTRLNDKLINYTIELEFANDKINNIR